MSWDGSLVFQCSSASRKFLNRRGRGHGRAPALCFSALQRAENSSIVAVQIVDDLVLRVSVLFSEPKIPQSSVPVTRTRAITRFSALQRAENSSIWIAEEQRDKRPRFSALQRAENSSIQRAVARLRRHPRVSVLFSEPKIPQSG